MTNLSMAEESVAILAQYAKVMCGNNEIMVAEHNESQWQRLFNEKRYLLLF